MDTQQVAIRLPLDTIARIDAYAARLAREAGRLTPTRSDAIRLLLGRALDEVEKK